LIVHEPTYYNHRDEHSDEKLECEKRKFIEETGITIYRFHDHPHYTTPDIICRGQVKALGLKGRVEYTDVVDQVRIYLDEPMTPVELAKLIEKKCNIKHLRICGAKDVKCSVVSGISGYYRRWSYLYGSGRGFFESFSYSLPRAGRNS